MRLTEASQEIRSMVLRGRTIPSSVFAGAVSLPGESVEVDKDGQVRLFTSAFGEVAAVEGEAGQID